MTNHAMLLAALLVAGIAPAAAQPGPPLNPPQQVTDVGRGIYVVSGGLNSTTVAVGSDGLILVDTQFAPRFQAITEAIRKISDKPIRYVINTHFHPDHVGGDAQFRQQGIDIVAHENVIKRLTTPPMNAFTGKPDQPTPPEALPNISYSGDSREVKVGGVTAELIHPSVPAHTDGDSIVIFREANVIVSGDIAGNHYPNIDLEVGGGIDGTIKAVDVIIGRMNDDTKVVPGHGPVLGKAEVVAFRNMLQTARDRIAKAKADGMTEEQVVKANLLADLDNPWRSYGPGAASSDRFPGNVYRSLP